MEGLEKKLDQARHYRPDLIEMRLDYLEDFRELESPGLRKLLHGTEILTLRSSKEGGEFKGSESERISLIKEQILPLSPRYLDIEIATLQKHPEILEAARSKTSVIASVHDLKGRILPKELGTIASEFPRGGRRIYATKIVRRANNFGDNFRVLELYNLSRLKGNLIAFCTGPLGIFSRVMCLIMGSPFTYASLPNEHLASGQLDIETMRDATKLARKGIR